MTSTSLEFAASLSTAFYNETCFDMLKNTKFVKRLTRIDQNVGSDFRAKTDLQTEDYYL